ncbi:hypothetical protein A8C32_13795 [Flavivirga aquatica]|uniref:Glycosyl hydrolase family 16 n=1 Tax=Flavivirga aquatica TaxID=1849968 RepID=A0A1E5TC53_9FLAO|nr:glycosyl hydrolase family 16 [Flavivirga aquatica]OEK08973.1 hypothetical protein A8C32_13795 [Flavivirga aquatica]
MKNIKFIYSTIAFFLGLIFMTVVSCDRDLSEDAELAGFPITAEVFIDGFSGGLEYFPFGDSKFSAFTVDNDVKYEGSASMRFDVPNFGDPEGAYAGAIFPDNSGRNLSGYDALTFWAKGSQAGTINEIGLGNDFGENKYTVTMQNLQLTTNWTKYIIPIPDPSKLKQEKGLFWYAEGPEDGKGYTFWIDELKYEKLGTIAQPRPAILGGVDDVQQSFIGANIIIGGLTQTFNLASGINKTVIPAPAYFTFSSSNPNVAVVDALGKVSIIGAGTTIITAALGNDDADGSLTIESLGDFVAAPIPTRDAANVISIFSDAYTNVPVDFYNGFFAPFQTTMGQNDITINGDNIIKYTELNFVASEFKNPTVNASEMTHLHIDVQIENELQFGDFIRIQLGDFGPNGAFDGGGDDSSGSVTFSSPTLVSGEWIGLDIPLADFSGLASTSNLAQLFFITDGTNPDLPGAITDILVDNMYFYKVPSSPTIAAPTPTASQANVISLFSDAYTDVMVDTWRTPWSAAATVLEDVTVDGNPVKKYGSLEFVGIETTSSTIDASGMTYIHLDTWSSTYTSFSIKLVDFGADGAFGGGDDSEYQLDFANPVVGEWVSWDIPLSDFTGLTSTGHIAQYILVAQPFEATDVFVDNMYFRN